MLAAAEVFLLAREGNGPYCAKLHHHNDNRCIFRHSGLDPTTPAHLTHRTPHGSGEGPRSDAERGMTRIWRNGTGGSIERCPAKRLVAALFLL